MSFTISYSISSGSMPSDLLEQYESHTSHASGQSNKADPELEQWDMTLVECLCWPAYFYMIDGPLLAGLRAGLHIMHPEPGWGFLGSTFRCILQGPSFLIYLCTMFKACWNSPAQQQWTGLTMNTEQDMRLVDDNNILLSLCMDASYRI